MHVVVASHRFVSNSISISMYTMPGYYQPTHPLTRLVCSTRDPPIRAPYARTWPRCRRRNDNRSRSISGDESVNVSTSCPSIWWVPNWRAHKPTNYYGRIHYIYYCIVSYRFFLQWSIAAQHKTEQPPVVAICLQMCHALRQLQRYQLWRLESQSEIPATLQATAAYTQATTCQVVQSRATASAHYGYTTDLPGAQVQQVVGEVLRVAINKVILTAEFLKISSALLHKVCYRNRLEIVQYTIYNFYIKFL